MYRTMLALIQRVSQASVDVEGGRTAEIGAGLLVFLCAVRGDSEQDIDYMARKVAQLRIFDDEQGKLDRSVQDMQGEVLVVSQFTLAADSRKGNRPSFDNAETPDTALDRYTAFVQRLRERGVSVETGVFAESMAVSLTNDGPVTILIDSRTRS